ncbi:hypothetical protein NAL94_09260 [Vibrio alginolyticus]|uniref:hypothetical protein n=1 Tax=Vibrio alginolyticus TaxID=663 RepID=UPI00197EF808|nr:hypothetical protein [Vibrio alginolyticus]QSI79691.1 hypothetical protein JYG29_09650 [Vibrio alginolyticus]URR28770.1 hypothetical protein NAL94_09260 [Vibrio alginolyticus]
MKTIQRSVLAISLLGLIAGCQLTASEPLQPTANQDIIESAKNELDGIEELEVSDEGVITFTQRLRTPGTYWIPARIKELSYDISCVQLSYFIDRGMIVKSAFLGARGRVEYYDMERCMKDTPFQ